MSRTSLHVTVSIAFHGCPGMLRQAVESILRQTHTDLTLVVVNDGDAPPWPLLADIEDPRLVRFDLPANRGPYFAHAMVLSATRAPYFLVQDADDWSEPHRIETLLRHLRAEDAIAAVSSNRLHRPRKPGPPATLRYPGVTRPLTNRLTHRIGHHGLFRSEALHAIGGYFGGFRIGYDTLLMNFLLMTDRVVWVREALYHQRSHDGSLTRAAATGIASPARRWAIGELSWMYSEAFVAYRRFLLDALDHEQLCAEIREIVRRRVSPAEEAALDLETDRLIRVLPKRAAARPGRVRVASTEGGREMPPAASRGDSLGIGLLAGRRLQLLRRTIDALRTRCPELLEEGFVVALCTGDDPEMQAYLDRLPWIDQHLRSTQGTLPAGSAASLLMETLASRQDIGTILYLEEGWKMVAEEQEWLEHARRILDDDPRVGQVRLRHARERVPSRHSVTSHAIHWTRGRGFLLAPDAHFSFNPSLLRALDVPRIFPCKSEREAQEHYLSSGLSTAQLLPGVFCRQ